MALTQELITDRASSANQSGWWKPFDTDRWGNKYFASCVKPINGASGGYHHVLISVRNADGSASDGYCCDGPGKLATWVNDVGHNTPSIAVDANGFIHVFTSMHVNEIRYYRSRNPYDVTSMERQFFEWPDTGWRFTYPVVTKDAAGAVYALFRTGLYNTTTKTQAMGVLYKWTPFARSDATDTFQAPPVKTGQWDRFSLIFMKGNRSFYPDDLRVSDAGKVHVLYEIGPENSGTLRHRGTLVLIDRLTRAITDIAGNPLSTPVSSEVSTANEVYQGLVSGEGYTPNTDPNVNLMAGIQTAKMIWDAETNTCLGVVYRYRPMRESSAGTFGGFGVRVAMWNGASWEHEDLFELDDGTVATSAALAATVHDATNRIYFSLEKGAAAYLCMAVGNVGNWTYYNLTPVQNYPKPLRFQFEKSAAGDTGYLTAPAAGLVIGLDVPVDLSDLTGYPSFNALIATL